MEGVIMKTMVYRVYLPAFYENGKKTFNVLERHLAKILDLQIDYVNLGGVFCGSIRNGKTSYRLKDCKSICGDYGSLADFKSFVTWCHKHHLKVILDLELARMDIPCWEQQGRLSEFAIASLAEIVKFWRRQRVDNFRISLPSQRNGVPLSAKQLKALVDACFDEKPLLLKINSGICGTKGYLGIANYLIDEAAINQMEDDPLKLLSIAQSMESRTALEIESESTSRIFSRMRISHRCAMRAMTCPNVSCACFYQGQEIGAKTPTLAPLPFLEYDKIGKEKSPFDYTAKLIHEWKK